jgi:hypothetical protein
VFVIAEEGFSVEKLLERIRKATGEEAWSAPGRTLTVLGDELVVHAPPGVHGIVARTLADLDARLGDPVAVESWLVAFSEAEWTARRDVVQRAGGIPEALFGDLLAVARSGAGARVISASAALGRAGSPFHSMLGRSACFVSDYDVVISTGAKAWDPVVERVDDGLLLHAGVLPASDGRLRVSLKSALAEASFGAPFVSDAESGGSVQTPVCDLVPLVCDAQVHDGKAFLAATAVREGPKGREVLAFLVRATSAGRK